MLFIVSNQMKLGR